MTRIEVATALAEARRNGKRGAPALPSALDLREAYCVQDEAASAYGSPRIGYKIGATSAEAQRIIGCDGPFFGPMFEADRIAPGSDLTLDETMLGLECEFAFQMARPFSATAGDSDRGADLEALADAIGLCVPAFEVVGTRFAGDGFPPASACIADFGLNSYFCPGGAIDNWRDLDLSEVSVTAAIDGVETNRGTGANVYGHPLAALMWLAGALDGQGRRLEAGDWISTGTCLGVVAMRPGIQVTMKASCGAELSLSLN